MYREMNEIETKYAKLVVDMLKERKLIDGMYCNDVAKKEGDDGICVFLDTEQAYALPSKDDDKAVARIVFNGMYESDMPDERDYDYKKPRFSFETLEALSEVFGSRKINIGDVECRGSGCDTCGHGGEYVLEVFVRDVKV